MLVQWDGSSVKDEDCVRRNIKGSLGWQVSKSVFLIEQTFPRQRSKEYPASLKTRQMRWTSRTISFKRPISCRPFITLDEWSNYSEGNLGICATIRVRGEAHSTLTGENLVSARDEQTKCVFGRASKPNGTIQSLSIGTTPRIGPLHGSQIGLAWMEYDDARVLIEAIATEAKDEELDDSF